MGRKRAFAAGSLIIEQLLKLRIENTRSKKGAIVRKNAEKESKDSDFTLCKNH